MSLKFLQEHRLSKEKGARWPIVGRTPLAPTAKRQISGANQAPALPPKTLERSMAEIDRLLHLIESVRDSCIRTIAMSHDYTEMTFRILANDRALIEGSRLALKESRELMDLVNRQLEDAVPELSF